MVFRPEEWGHRDSIFRTLVRNIYKYHNNEIFAVLRNEYTDWEYGVKNNSAIVQQNLYEDFSFPFSRRSCEVDMVIPTR